MNSIYKHTKINSSLQKELAEYGIMRTEAKSKAGKDYFALSNSYDGYKANYSEDLEDLKIGNGMDLAMLAPDNTEFNLLAPKDLADVIPLNDPNKVRRFLSKLLDSI